MVRYIEPVDSIKCPIKTFRNGPTLEGVLKVRKLAENVARREGHKSQTRMGDIYEIIGLIADESYNCPDSIRAIVQLGIQRAKRKRSAKRKP